MLPKTLVGDDNFKNLVLKSDVFVDKTLLIEDIIDNPASVILITRPRRWCKSMNLSMLKHFLEMEVDKLGAPIPQEQSVNHKLFVGGEVDLGLGLTKKLKPLRIANDSITMRHQGQYPVILANFKEIKGDSYEEIEKKIKLRITNLYQHYRYLEQYLTPDHPLLSEHEKTELVSYFKGNLDKARIEGSLQFLSSVLHKHFGKKVYILIDEYDASINDTYNIFGGESEDLRKVIALLRGILGSALKSNEYLEKGILTGILRIAKASLFSDLNNVSENTLLDEAFAKFYGFTQEEVDQLLSVYNHADANIDPERIKSWYNGYNFGGETIYNPWSIMQCLSRKGVIDRYWVDSGKMGIMDKTMVSDETQEALQILLKGESITTPITKQISFEDLKKPSGFFSLMLFSGYLNPHVVDSDKSIYSLSIPNQEVRLLYESRITDWLVDKLQIDSTVYYNFITLLAQNKPDEFKAKLQEFLQNATSFHQTGEKKAEIFYSGFMLGLVNTLSTTHQIDSERESGDGRPDIVLMPKSGRNNEIAIIIEYKIAENSESLAAKAVEALQQIEDKKYDAKLKEQSHIKQILKIGMAFSGKDVEMVYVTNSS